MFNKGAEKCRNKSLPHYDDLYIIFGKDRAQGNRAEDCEDMTHNENVEEELLQMEDDFNEQSKEISPKKMDKVRKLQMLVLRKGNINLILSLWEYLKPPRYLAKIFGKHRPPCLNL